jgi:hypothetical protein
VTQLGVNVQALTAASGVLRAAANEFGQARTRIAVHGEPAGATAEATGILARTLAGATGALSRAQGELQQVADHLAATAEGYASTERALSQWTVPGSGGQAGGTG